MNKIWMNAIRAAAGGGGFVGPLDGYSNIAAAYSVRRLLSAYEGNLIRLRRDPGNAESDFGYDGNGDLDTAAITTWLGGGSGYVVTWYDQSGNARDVVQATADNQPLYVASGPNSKPTVLFDGINDRLRKTFANIPQPHHIFATAKLESYTDGDYMFAGGATLEIAVLEAEGTGRVLMITGPTGPSKAMGTSAYRVMGFYYTTVLGANYIRMDGNQSTGAGVVVGKASVTGVTLGARGDQTKFGNVDMSEWIMFNAEQSNSPLEVNMGTYYGITIP